MGHQTIETERLLLRRWTNTDHAPFAKMCADPHIMQYIGSGAIRTADDVARQIAAVEAEWNDKGYGLFAVELKQSSEFIGFTGLSTPNFLPEIMPSVEIGWRLSKAHWGQGYATEAAKAALSFGVNKLGLCDIVSIYQIENAASERIMEKIGLIFDRQTIDPSCNRDVHVYRLPK